MAKDEERIGAQGLPNEARESNKLRYQYGRIKYHIDEALGLGVTDDERTVLEMMRDEFAELHNQRSLEAGEASDTLGVKGKRAKDRAKEPTE